MNTLLDLVKSPSAFDSLSNYMGALPEKDLLVLMTRNRDADTLTESNWLCSLRELGGEGDNVEIHRFGHWACGWWEALCVRKGSDQEKIAQEIADSLTDYPVLNDEHFSEMETEEADRTWKDCYNDAERLDYLRKNRGEIDMGNSFSLLLACARGEFAPYTNCGYEDFLGC
jgi:hypothetical protein